MFNPLRTVKQKIHRDREIRAERHSLSKFRATHVDPWMLRQIRPAELASMLDGKIDSEWKEVSSEINSIITIEDNTTGGVNPGDRRAIFYLIRSLKPESILEIGTNVGASTMHIAAAMKRRGNSKLVTVDLFDVNAPDAYWKVGGLPRSPRDNVMQLGMGDRVEFRVSDSVDFLSSTPDRYDFIFLDGDHGATKVFKELPLALQKLNPSGSILLHDFFPKNVPLWSNGSVVPGPWLAVERLRDEGINIQVLPLGKLRWPTKLRSSLTSLALVTRP